jgi:hypothetical protein
MKCQEISPIARSDAEKVLSEDSAEAIASVLVRLACHESDWKWIQNICIGLSSHADKWVRRTCVTCFGHLARIHHVIEREKVLPVLTRLLSDPDVRGEAEDAIEDLKKFLK